jgi:pimeloyl-ACP methyl ester carboxylesterase
MKVTTNGVTLEVVDEGRGEPVLLLHGFPDSAALWRHQIPALVEAGYRVIAPDLRGFGESDRPADPAAYAMPVLIADVLGLLKALDVERAAVVGHDWGGHGPAGRAHRGAQLVSGQPAADGVRADQPGAAAVGRRPGAGHLVRR